MTLPARVYFIVLKAYRWRSFISIIWLFSPLLLQMCRYIQCCAFIWQVVIHEYHASASVPLHILALLNLLSYLSYSHVWLHRGSRVYFGRRKKPRDAIWLPGVGSRLFCIRLKFEILTELSNCALRLAFGIHIDLSAYLCQSGDSYGYQPVAFY